jgi:hypothetical protein
LVEDKLQDLESPPPLQPVLDVRNTLFTALDCDCGHTRSGLGIP